MKSLFVGTLLGMALVSSWYLHEYETFDSRISEELEATTCTVREDSSTLECETLNGKVFEVVVGKLYSPCNSRWGWATPAPSTLEEN